MNQIILDLEVLVEKRGGLSIIGLNAADFCGSEKNVLRTFERVKLTHCHAIKQIEFSSRAPDEITKALRLQLSPNRAAHQAAVTCDINARLLLHGRKLKGGKNNRKLREPVVEWLVENV